MPILDTSAADISAGMLQLQADRQMLIQLDNKRHRLNAAQAERLDKELAINRLSIVFTQRWMTLFQAANDACQPARA